MKVNKFAKLCKKVRECKKILSDLNNTTQEDGSYFHFWAKLAVWLKEDSKKYSSYTSLNVLKKIVKGFMKGSTNDIAEELYTYIQNFQDENDLDLSCSECKYFFIQDRGSTLKIDGEFDTKKSVDTKLKKFTNFSDALEAARALKKTHPLLHIVGETGSGETHFNPKLI